MCHVFGTFLDIGIFKSCLKKSNQYLDVPIDVWFDRSKCCWSQNIYKGYNNYSWYLTKYIIFICFPMFIAKLMKCPSTSTVFSFILSYNVTSSPDVKSCLSGVNLKIYINGQNCIWESINLHMANPLKSLWNQPEQSKQKIFNVRLVGQISQIIIDVFSDTILTVNII